MALAWFLEDGSRKFYSELAATLPDKELKDLYSELANAEEHHQDSLRRLYEQFSGKASEAAFPGAVLPPGKEGGDVMEGGMSVSDALKWAKGKKLIDLLELSLSLETHSYDLYLKMGRQMKDRRSAQVFRMLSSDEKEHLERLSLFLQNRHVYMHLPP
jgi:rubrerythrin